MGRMESYDRFRTLVREILANIPTDLPKTIRRVQEKQLTTMRIVTNGSSWTKSRNGRATDPGRESDDE